MCNNRHSLTKFAVFTLISLALASCGKENFPSSKDEARIVPSTSDVTPHSTTTNAAPQPVHDSNQSQEGVNVNDLIGSPLTSYPDLRPVNDDFSESLFRNRATISDKNAAMPIYRIEIDPKALNDAVEKLSSKFGLKETKRENGVTVYSNGDKTLAVNTEIGSLRFHDLSLYQVGAGVAHVDKTKLLKTAQNIFEELVPADLLKESYFYRYGEYINSASEGDKLLPDLVYEVGVGLNSTVDGVPIIGSGGKYGIDLKPDGQIASVDMQFARFVKTEDIVRIKDSTSALNETKIKAEKSGIDFGKYTIPRTEFGYAYQSKRGAVKWLVPTYSIFVVPKENEAGSATAYFVPASDDPIAHERFDEDVRSDENRKAFLYEDGEIPTADEKPQPVSGHSPTNGSVTEDPIDSPTMNQ